MKIAWLFPVNQKCGISFYSKEYVKALSDLVEIETFDIEECLSNLQNTEKKINQFDIIHIQYETSFFLNGESKGFKKLCLLLQKPLVVSLHEVYDSFPGVFPRSQIKGRGITRKVKEMLYDKKHPYQTAYREHESQHFFSNKLIVHGQFQKDILVQHDVPQDKISVIPMPIQVRAPSVETTQKKTDTVELASMGFINQNFNYPLLFRVLDSLEIPWKFTWIGGLRREEDKPLLNSINEEVAQREWQNKFVITGWVSEEELNHLLAQADILLALFSERSSSLSLATALGARKIIIALMLPLTKEIAQDKPVIRLVAPEANPICDMITKLSSDNALRNTCLTAIDEYAASHSFLQMAKRLTELYRELIT